MPNPLPWLRENSDWILPATGIGLQALGSIGASREQGRANDISLEDYELKKRQAEDDKQRRDAFTRLMMPSLLRDMNIRDPELIGQSLQQRTLPPTTSLGQPQGDPYRDAASGVAGAPVRSPGVSTASNVAKGVGAGLGVAGAMGLGSAALGPAGAVLGLAAAPLLNKIGQGRRTADLLTTPGGATKQFEQQVGSIHDGLVQLDASGKATAEDFQKGIADLRAGEQAYRQYLSNFAMGGGNHAKVARQALATLDRYQPLVYRTLEGRLAEMTAG